MLKFRKKTKISSQRWLHRHFHDVYVKQARKEGYRSRAAYKLLEIQKKFCLLKSQQTIIDLGCAPGSWCQVVRDIVKKGAVIGVDLLVTEAMDGVKFIQGDFEDPCVQTDLKNSATFGIDGVLSDLAPTVTGHRSTDRIRTLRLLRSAFEFSREVLQPGGFFIAPPATGRPELRPVA